MVNIKIHRLYRVDVKKEKIITAITSTLLNEKLDPQNIIVTVVISNDKFIKNLNDSYLHSNLVTDVLAFPAAENDPETNKLYLGDIILSFPQLKKQSNLNPNGLDGELSLLCVHGALHLLNYDHGTLLQKKKMWKKQTEIMAELGYSDIIHDSAE
jgi:probable rRNA maturation factor